ncbi:MAG: periplasmic nitrate reductase, NapE protein [Saccharospirillum sp.]
MPPGTRSQLENRVFVFLIVLLFPTLAVMVVDGYGFAVWIRATVFRPA